jgi:hypothetical protein
MKIMIYYGLLAGEIDVQETGFLVEISSVTLFK